MNAGVYVADGGQEINLQPGGDGFNISGSQFENLFAKFLVGFKESGETIYMEQMRRIRAQLDSKSTFEQAEEGQQFTSHSQASSVSIRLDLEHLAKWRPVSAEVHGEVIRMDDASEISDGSMHPGSVHWGEVMMQAIRRQPLKFLPGAENAIRQIYAEGVAHSAADSTLPTSSTDIHRLPYIQLEIVSKQRPLKIRGLKATEVESLVVIPGIVLQASKPQHKATVLKVQCKDCKAEKFVRIPPWRQSVTLPRVCDTAKQGDERCSLDPYVVLSDESFYTDVQQIKIQELPEDVPTGDMPRHLVLNCCGAVCSRITPGDRVMVAGVFSSFERTRDNRGGDDVRAPYIHVVGLDYIESSGQRKKSSWSYQEEESFRQLSQDPDIIDKVSKSIAPAVFGLENVKRSIGCLLFGGSGKKLHDRTRLRGDINVLLLGDPSTAKSQFLKFVDRCAPIAVYTSGKGSSAAGLTAAIVRDAAGNFALEGGAMVLADGGVVCIDEFDKMRDDDRVAIHEAMEQQTISIAKAGITTVLTTKCSVLAAANPSFGSYDDSKDTTEQHDFETTILSRFDLIWVIRDERSIERDQTIASHVFALHAGAADESAFQGPIHLAKLRQYIGYCRNVCHPRLSESSAKKLENYYVEVREGCRSDTRRRRDQIPITVRQLESLARISESLAKMSLSSDVDDWHVDEAIRLFHLATVEASKSSLSRENLTPAEMELVKNAEEAILQRLPIHARASKATIVRDLRMRGYEASHVSRAVRVLIQRGVLEERGDASVRRLPSSDV